MNNCVSCHQETIGMYGGKFPCCGKCYESGELITVFENCANYKDSKWYNEILAATKEQIEFMRNSLIDKKSGE